MEHRQKQSALREWRQHMSRPQTLLIMGAVGLVLGIAGPFGTEDALRLLPRMAYWVATVAACYAIGALVGEVLEHRLSGRLPWRAIFFAIVISTGLAITVFLYLWNRALFGAWIPRGELPGFAFSVIAIALVFAGTMELIHRNRMREADTEPPRLLERLPADKRGALVALSVEDHYVRIRTTKGEDMVLLRLSDAMRETGDTHGDQVHRSHWIAWDHVGSARREGDRAILTMRGGFEIPVSRAHVAKLRERGLLPR